MSSPEKETTDGGDSMWNQDLNCEKLWKINVIEKGIKNYEYPKRK